MGFCDGFCEVLHVRVVGLCPFESGGDELDGVSVEVVGAPGEFGGDAGESGPLLVDECFGV